MTNRLGQQLLGDLVDGYLALDSKRGAVLEDGVAKPGDPWLHKPDVSHDYVTCGEAVYWYAGRPGDPVQRLLRWGLGFFACLVLAPLHIDWAPASQVAASRLSELATRGEYVSIPAFDFESHLVWEPARPGG
jgi:hypothetical protein